MVSLDTPTIRTKSADSARDFPSIGDGSRSLTQECPEKWGESLGEDDGEMFLVGINRNVVDDRRARGVERDNSGPLVTELLAEAGSTTVRGCVCRPVDGLQQFMGLVGYLRRRDKHGWYVYFPRFPDRGGKKVTRVRTT